jgi:hypothetical protein
VSTIGKFVDYHPNNKCHVSLVLVTIQQQSPLLFDLIFTMGHKATDLALSAIDAQLLLANK